MSLVDSIGNFAQESSYNFIVRDSENRTCLSDQLDSRSSLLVDLLHIAENDSGITFHVLGLEDRVIGFKNWRESKS